VAAWTSWLQRAKSTSHNRFSQPQQYFSLTQNQPSHQPTSQPTVFSSHAKSASHPASQPNKAKAPVKGGRAGGGGWALEREPAVVHRDAAAVEPASFFWKDSQGFRIF